MAKIIIKTKEQIEGIRQSSKLAASTLKYIAGYVKEGVSTAFLDAKIEEFIRDNGAIPAPLNYNGFPKASCISLNEVVCHGIPNAKEILKDGDILNIDVTTILNGFYGDTSRMFSIGNIDPKAAKLIEIAQKCLDIGIQQCYPENYIGNIGYEIAQFAHANACSVVYEYCGHGVGIQFHEPPEIAHIAEKNSGPKIKKGMVFTVEPMINLGKARTKLDKKDGWTVRTIDNKLSAQFEHTLVITDQSCEVLTDLDGYYK
jgi:methionyl aminopeptidase